MDFLFDTFLGQPAWLWLSFLAGVLTLLYVDLFLLNKKDHVIEFKESMRLAGIYAALGLAYGVWVYLHSDTATAADYFTVWILELSLSMDNLFVMSVIFASFQIPRQYQHRVLVWGILGVILLRGIMIGAGTAIVHEFTWVLYIFAVILIITGIKLLGMNEEEKEDYTQKSYVKFMAKHMRVDPYLHGNNFFVKLKDNSGKLITYATPLFLCLLTIELTDVMFAFDSVPAALAITTDPYVIYTANIFAILGLRALFFAIEHIIHRFVYLKYSLSIVMVFIGLKVFYNGFVGHIPGPVSLLITVSVLAAGVIFSMMKTRGDKA